MIMFLFDIKTVINRGMYLHCMLTLGPVNDVGCPIEWECMKKNRTLDDHHLFRVVSNRAMNEEFLMEKYTGILNDT